MLLFMSFKFSLESDLGFGLSYSLCSLGLLINFGDEHLKNGIRRIANNL
jgi:hypothetical protein